MLASSRRILDGTARRGDVSLGDAETWQLALRSRERRGGEGIFYAFRLPSVSLFWLQAAPDSSVSLHPLS